MGIDFERKLEKIGKGEGGSVRVVIPKEIKNALGLKAGDVLLINLNGSYIVALKKEGFDENVQ